MDRDRQRCNALHLRIVQQFGIAQRLHRKGMDIVTPEQSIAHHQHRHAKDARAERSVGVAAQGRLDCFACQHAGIDAQRLDQRRQRFRTVRSAPFGPDPAINRIDRLGRRVRGNVQPQRRDRIERMRGRKPQRNAFAPRLPQHTAISEFAFAWNFRRPFLAMRVQDRSEQDRHQFHRLLRRQFADFLPMQIRELRDEIEIPAQGRRCAHDVNARVRGSLRTA